MTDRTEHGIRRGFFTYPWDLLDEGTERVLGWMAGEAACSAVLVSAQYHHARVLRPRADGPLVRRFDGALAAFQPQKDLYPDQDLIPEPAEALAEAGVLEGARNTSREHGLDFGLWVVGLHNSTLGERLPELTVENAFGDRYTYSLCPSQALNREYLTALVKDTCAQFQPDRIVLEAPGPLGLQHGLHHELFLFPVDPVLDLVTSLCFCPDCLASAGLRGLDGAAVRREAARIGRALLEAERGSLPAAFRTGETASLLLEVPELWEYLQIGTEAVISLVGEVRGAAREHGAALEVIPASFHRPSSLSWLERGRLSRLAKAADGLLVAAYHEDPARVRADLDWVNLVAPEVELTAGLNACHPTPSEAALAGSAAAARGAGSRGIYFYNYGLLTEQRLAWAARTLRGLAGADKGA